MVYWNTKRLTKAVLTHTHLQTSRRSFITFGYITKLLTLPEAREEKKRQAALLLEVLTLLWHFFNSLSPKQSPPRPPNTHTPLSEADWQWGRHELNLPTHSMRRLQRAETVRDGVVGGEWRVVVGSKRNGRYSIGDRSMFGHQIK